MTRFAPLVLLAAVLACAGPDETAEKAEELGQRAADRAEDVANKTAADAKLVAKQTAKEANRLADETQRAAERAGDRIAKRVGAAGEDISEVLPEPASPEEVRAELRDVDAAIECDGKGGCTVTRDFADRLRERPEVIAAQARLEPEPQGTGLRISNLGELPRHLGFEHGDVVTEINGVALTGTRALPQLMLQLSASRYTIHYVRGGSEHTLQIDVV
jgi:hypothetical protein